MKCFVFCLLIAATAFSPAAAQMTNPPAMSADRVERAGAGENLTFVVRIDTLNRREIQAHILNHVAGMSYQATHTPIAIYASDDVAVVMGTRDDLKPGTVVYLYAVKTKAHGADANKIVVLSPYVSVR